MVYDEVVPFGIFQEYSKSLLVDDMSENFIKQIVVISFDNGKFYNENLKTQVKLFNVQKFIFKVNRVYNFIS